MDRFANVPNFQCTPAKVVPRYLVCTGDSPEDIERAIAARRKSAGTMEVTYIGGVSVTRWQSENDRKGYTEGGFWYAQAVLVHEVVTP